MHLTPVSVSPASTPRHIGVRSGIIGTLLEQVGTRRGLELGEGVVEAPERGPARPDGASERRPRASTTSAVERRPAESGVMQSTPRTVKLPRFSGKEPLESYLAQVRLAERQNGWRPREAAVHLALALEGEALKVLADRPVEELEDLEQLLASLKQRFGEPAREDWAKVQLGERRRRAGETWGALAGDLRGYARRAYPSFTAEAQERLALDAFLNALTPSSLQQHVRLHTPTPTNLLEALEETEKAEFILGSQAGAAIPRRATGGEVEPEGGPGEAPVRHSRTEGPGRRRGSKTKRRRASKSSQAPLKELNPRVGLFGDPDGIRVDCTVAGVPCRALVDTGSTITLLRPGVLPETRCAKPPGWETTTVRLSTVTGDKAAMRGKRRLPLLLQGVRVEQEFWLADVVEECILGMDALARMGAVVDTGTGQLRVAVAANAVLSKEGERAATGPSSETRQAVRELQERDSQGLNAEQRADLERLLTANVDLFAARDEECTRTGLVRHRIETGGAAPIRLRPHRLALDKQQAAEEKVREMAAAGVIEPSSSPWAAPAVLVKKKDDSWRFCVDFRRLNDVTVKDSYPLPRIDETLDAVGGSRWFTSLDLRSGYWQVELAEEAKPKTAFSIGHGLWQFKVMPFGLCNSPATFERLMERVLRKIPRSKCVVYLDDLLVHAKTFEEAVENLEEVLEAIRTAGLKLNPKKCTFLRQEVTFLGHVISRDGVATDPGKVAAVRDWPPPRSVREVRSFLGLASYYRRFVRGFAAVARPLHQLTEKGRAFAWSAECGEAFERLRAALVEAPVLMSPDLTKGFVVDTDASEGGLGAVLSQVTDEGERVVAYYSCALSRPERNYCVTRKELLAVVKSLRHFRPYVGGRPFVLRTDHASLTWLLSFRNPEGQLARWIEALQEYQFDTQHRPGRQHCNADALSRRPCETGACRHCARAEEREWGDESRTVEAVRLDHGVDESRLKRAQGEDPVLGRVREWLEGGHRPAWGEISAAETEVKTYWSQWQSLALKRGLCYRGWQHPDGQRVRWQLLVPRELRQEVLRSVHGVTGAGHFGVTKTLARLRQAFYWPSCRRDVEVWVHRCDACTAKKGPGGKSRAPMQVYVVGAPMERVGVDVLGPFPRSEAGNRYVLVAMDYFTKWPEAYAVADQSAETVATKLVEEFFSRFGAPEELHSDQGRNFESQLLAEVCAKLGVQKTRTTPLHPQSDGLVERFNRTLATQLAIMVADHQRDWDRHLPLVLWAYRTAEQESTQCTPAALMMGRELRTPTDLAFGPPPEPELVGPPGLDYAHRLSERLRAVHTLARTHQEGATAKQKRAYDLRSRGRDFQAEERVWVYCPTRKKGRSPKLDSHWRGPARVLKRVGEVVYRVRVEGRRKTMVVHRDRLAPYHPKDCGGTDIGGPDTGETDNGETDIGEMDTGGAGAVPGPVGGPRRTGRRRQPPARLRDCQVDFVVAEGGSRLEGELCDGQEEVRE